jgi:response regulator of citrate/malate metabolism
MPSAQNKKGHSVLVVEDVEEMRELFAALLAEIPEVGRVSFAQNLGEARLLMSRQRPALILCDEVLPGESPLDWIKELQGEPDPVAILFITGVLNRAEKLPPGVKERLFKPEWHQLKADCERFRKAILAVFQD